MSVTRDEVKKLAALSQLSLSEQELETLTKDMESIIAFADTINQVSVENDDFDNIHGIVNAQREDEVRPSLDRELILKNVDGGERGYFKVKRRV